MDGLLSRLTDYNERALQAYRGLTTSSKISLWLVFGLHSAIAAAVIYAGPQHIFELLAGWADQLRDMQLGWLFLILAILITSIPPLMGYGSFITICGFAFGLKGWFIAVTGCLLGALVSFLLCRRFLKAYWSDWLNSSQTFQGLSKAISVKGLPLIVLIRLCPLSFPYSNLFFSSMEETVSLTQFMLATLVITPKLALHVWVGQRIYFLADPNSRSQMDDTTKMINGFYIAGGSLLGFFTGLYVYRLTMKYVREVALSDEDIEASHQFGAVDHDSEEDDMSREELDRQLRAEGIMDGNEGGGGEDKWHDDAFSDFSHDDEEELEARDDDTIRSAEALTPRATELKRDYLD